MNVQKNRVKAWIGMMAVLFVAGCGGSPRQAPPPPAAAAQPASGAQQQQQVLLPTGQHDIFTNKPIKDESPLNNYEDKCGTRIDDLAGPLLQYYSARHHGPAKIEELNRYAIVGEPLTLTCPVSGKAYLCAADGLRAPGEKYVIYLYDPEPVHHGERWCVVSDGAITGAMGFSTIHMPESKFRLYAPTAAAEVPPTTQPSAIPGDLNGK